MKSRELCFQFKSKDLNQSHEDEIINILIDFALDNKVSVGGNLDTGFCFCVDIDNEIPINLKSNFINFMSKSYTQLFDEIIFN